MNLEQELAAASARLHEWINRSVAQRLRRLNEKGRKLMVADAERIGAATVASRPPNEEAQ
jgi:hypothetical protein